MKFDLSEQEIELLHNKGIVFDKSREYSDDEALDLLDQVRDIEISYSQFTTESGKALYLKYGDIADKMQSQIPS